MDVAAATILIILSLTPGFLFWAGFYSPVHGYLEYDISSWRTPGQLARTLVTAHVIHLLLSLALMAFSIGRPALEGWFTSCGHLRGCVGPGLLAAVAGNADEIQQALFQIIGGSFKFAPNSGFFMLNLYLIAAAAIAYAAGRICGNWGINPQFQGTRREKWARHFVAHRFVHELVQDVQFKGVLKTAFLLARFDESGTRCIYRGIVEDFSFSQSGTLVYVVLSTLAKAKRTGLASPDGDHIQWAAIGHRESGRAYFRGDEIENAVFENAPSADSGTKFSSPSQVEEYAFTLSDAVLEMLGRMETEGKIKPNNQK